MLCPTKGYLEESDREEKEALKMDRNGRCRRTVSCKGCGFRTHSTLPRGHPFATSSRPPERENSSEEEGLEAATRGLKRGLK